MELKITGDLIKNKTFSLLSAGMTFLIHTSPALLIELLQEKFQIGILYSLILFVPCVLIFIWTGSKIKKNKKALMRKIFNYTFFLSLTGWLLLTLFFIFFIGHYNHTFYFKGFNYYSWVVEYNQILYHADSELLSRMSGDYDAIWYDREKVRITFICIFLFTAISWDFFYCIYYHLKNIEYSKKEISPRD
jgi:hypothetical protein